MTIDHLSFASRDLAATRRFYEGPLGFPVLIHEWMLMQEGGRVDHMFFDCGGGCALAFMQWIDVPGVPTDPDTSINRGLGLPSGTFHFAFRCDDLTALEARRQELIVLGVVWASCWICPPIARSSSMTRSMACDWSTPSAYKRPLQPIAIRCSGSFRPAWRCSSRRAVPRQSRRSL